MNLFNPNRTLDRSKVLFSFSKRKLFEQDAQKSNARFGFNAKLDFLKEKHKVYRENNGAKKQILRKSGKSLRTNRGNPPSDNQKLFIFAYVEKGRILSLYAARARKGLRPTTE